MKLKKACVGGFAGAFAFLAAATVSAHDFWMEPVAHVDNHDNVALALLVGHARERNPWRGVKNISSVEIYDAKGKRQNAEVFIDEDASKILAKRPGREKSILLAIESTHSYSVLGAEEFNAYVEEEGLTAIREHRNIKNLNDAPGRERYSRRAKTIIQLDASAAAAFASNPVGHKLEVVPVNDVFARDESGLLTFRILYDGAPLNNAQVSFENLDVGLLARATMISDDNGLAWFSAPPGGAWKVNVVWSSPLETDADPDADYETVFASLTFATHPAANP